MNKKKILMALLIMIVCSFGTMKAQAAVKVTKVTATTSQGKTVNLIKGHKIKLKTKITVKPNKKVNKKLVYKSANRKVATVSTKGVIKAVGVGSTKITVSSKMNKKKKATIKVKVTQKITSLTISKTSLTLLEKKTAQLTYSISPNNGVNKAVQWSTSNASVATVNKGLITALKAGTAVITVKALDGSNKSASCTVTVEEDCWDLPYQYVCLRTGYTNTYYLLFGDYCDKNAEIVDFQVRGIGSDIQVEKDLTNKLVKLNFQPKVCSSQKKIEVVAICKDGIKIKQCLCYTVIGTENKDYFFRFNDVINVPAGQYFKDNLVNDSAYSSSYLGTINYELVGDAKGITFDGYNLCGMAPSTGSKTVTIKQTFSKLTGVSNLITVKINGCGTCAFSGHIVDNLGKNICDQEVTFVDISSREAVYRTEIDQSTNEKGYCYTTLKANTKYLVKLDAYPYFLGTIETGNNNQEIIKDIKLKLDQVVLNDLSGMSYISSWRDSSGTSYGRSGVFVESNKLMKLYNLASDTNNSYLRYLVSVDVQYNGDNQSFTPAIVDGSTTANDIYCGITDVNVKNGASVWYKFVPTETKEYVISSTGSVDTLGSLLDAAKTTLCRNDDSGSGNNFKMTSQLTANTVYYIAAGYYSSSSNYPNSCDKSFQITIE